MRQWTAEDPGIGNPSDIRADAGQRQSGAANARTAAGHAASVAGLAQAGSWEGATASAVAAKAGEYNVQLSKLASESDSDAAALLKYAGDIETIQIALNSISTAHDTVVSQLHAKRRLLNETDATSDPTLHHRLQSTVDDLGGQLRGLKSQVQQLAQQRSAADGVAVMALSSTASRGGLAPYVGGVSGAGTSVPTLNDLAGLDEMDLAALLALNPSLIDKVLKQNSAPKAVSKWWASLSADQQDAMALGAPALVGNLGGIPTMVRVAANRINAYDQLQTVNKQIQRDKAESEAPPIVSFDPTAQNQLQSQIQQQNSEDLGQLEEEKKYLQQVIDGDKQLYMYRPEKDQIVEMIGTPGPSTDKTITYVPGTFTNQQSFYGGDVQAVGTWINQRDPNAVIFVWKGAEFPGQAPGTPTVPGLLDANQAPLALSTGKSLAGFETDIASDPYLAGAQHDAIAHSWGLAATTGSEMGGAHYDKVFSLSGAWMPPGWKPEAGTDYYHYTYSDFLTVTKDFGLVGNGNIPDTSSAFAKPLGDPISTGGDFTLTLPTSMPTDGMTAPTQPYELHMNWDLSATHSQVASSDADNLRVLNSIWQAMK